jgi:hypothetical protein
MGKIIAVLVVVVILAAVGASVYFFVLSPVSNSGSAGVAPVVPPGGKASAATSPSVPASESAPIVDPMQKPLESTFTFRNVFAPTLKMQMPVIVTSGSTTTGSSTTGGSSTATASVKVPADTLYLQSIQTVDGHKSATFIWNNNTYVLAEGETIPDTPWKVVSIGETSAVMLFGDTEITLTTGQGLTK